MQEFNDKRLSYRKGVGAIILNHKNQVFVGKRRDAQQAWQMPQGGIDKNELPKNSVIREVLEEIGTDKLEILGQTKSWYHYDIPRNLRPHYWRSRYKGQRQKWFVLRFIGKDTDINLNYYAQPEFTEWRWVDADQLINLVVEFKKDLYSNVLFELRDFLNGGANH